MNFRKVEEGGFVFGAFDEGLRPVKINIQGPGLREASLRYRCLGS